MNKTYSFTVIGTPIAKKRPRFITSNKAGKQFTRNVNIQQTEEGRFLWEILTQWDNRPILTGPLHISFKFIFPRPKSHYGTGGNSGILKKSAPKYCHKVSKDCDNMEKFAMDSMNRYIYKDDRQAVKLSSEKVWINDIDDKARTEITIIELEDQEGENNNRERLREVGCNV